MRNKPFLSQCVLILNHAVQYKMSVDFFATLFRCFENVIFVITHLSSHACNLRKMFFYHTTFLNSPSNSFSRETEPSEFPVSKRLIGRRWIWDILPVPLWMVSSLRGVDDPVRIKSLRSPAAVQTK